MDEIAGGGHEEMKNIEEKIELALIPIVVY